MTRVARTLWDLLIGPGHNKPKRPRSPGKRNPAKPRPSPTQQRYDALVEEMKRTYDVRVRKWRTSSTGCAWIVRYSNGDEQRLIESPYPRGPMSCAIFLHEIGHHAIGFGRYKPRCLEEFHAWMWALEMMRHRGLNVTEAVQRRMARSLGYAIAKARRRGLRALPPELLQFELSVGRAD